MDTPDQTPATARVAPARATDKSKAFPGGAVPLARVSIQATYNNILVSFARPNGDVIAWSSSGTCGFRGPKKATPYAAQTVIRTVAEKARPFGIREVHVFLRGVGGGREAAVRALNSQGLNVLSIKDVTPVPHNGCRRPRARRV